jgi:hypothetical protein
VPVPVVFDVNVVVLAVGAAESPFRSWPSPPPPTSGNPSADCLGVINDAAEFALWLSPHILVNTGRVLTAVLKAPDEEVDEYLDVLAEMAEASGAASVTRRRQSGTARTGRTIAFWIWLPRWARSSSSPPRRT